MLHRSESGFALMEVLVSMAVLVVLVLGVLAAVDAVTRTAGANQARTIAAVLAERDQEELRSLRTADVDQLATLIPDPRTYDVGGADYTVTSRAQWVSDSTADAVSCSMASGQGSYLRITSTVTSRRTGEAVKPVVLTSLVAPLAGSGTLSVQVRNALEQPVSGLAVQAVGPTTRAVTTNDAGCAVFGQVDAGTYVARLDRAGWVDRPGNQLTEGSGTVSAGNLTTIDMSYDRAATVNASVTTQRPGQAVQADQGTGVVLSQTGLPIGSRVAPATVPAASLATHQVTGLFPFPTDYRVYAGRCTAADPAKTTPPSAAPSVVLAPGGASAVTVLEPALDLKVTTSTGSAAPGIRVYAYPYPKPVAPETASPCGGRIDLGTTLSDGKLQYPGLPFGTYDVCIESGTKANSTYRRELPGHANLDPAGQAVTMVAPATGGACGTGASPS